MTHTLYFPDARVPEGEKGIRFTLAGLNTKIIEETLENIRGLVEAGAMSTDDGEAAEKTLWRLYQQYAPNPS